MEIISASSCDYGTYYSGDQWGLRRACASVRSHQSLRCSHTWSMEVDMGSHLASLDGCACALKNEFTETKSTIISWDGSILLDCADNNIIDRMDWKVNHACFRCNVSERCGVITFPMVFDIKILTAELERWVRDMLSETHLKDHDTNNKLRKMTIVPWVPGEEL